MVFSFIRLACATLVFAGVSEAARAADEPLALEVRVNGFPTNKIGEFVQRGRVLLSRRQELTDLGIRVPQGSAAPRPDDLVPLSDLTGLTWQIDQKTQTLYIKAPDNRLLPQLLKLEAGADTMAPVESGIGALLNYDITGVQAGGQLVSSGLYDLRVFSPLGVAGTGFLGTLVADHVAPAPHR